MWEVYEHRNVIKRLRRTPQEVLKRYEKWKDIVEVSGPDGLKLIKGLRDEALQSSRLNQQYRVIYRVESDKMFVLVLEVTPHDYRRR